MKASPLVFAPFEKVDQQDDGTLIVSGIASSEAVDSSGEIVKAAAIRTALPDYMAFGAVREMHQPHAAGTAISCTVDEGGITRLVAHIVDASSILKVKTNVLKGFSIGGKVTKRNTLRKNEIEGIRLTEISLVDRPSNPDAMIELVKVDRENRVTLCKALKPAEASTQLPLAKSLYDVGALAELIQRLNALMCWAQDEKNWEGDASTIPARMKACVADLCGIIRDMVDEETQELLGIADEVVTPEELIEAAAKCESLVKKGAKFSKATVGVLATVHQLLKDADTHMAGIGYAKADNQESEDEEMTDAEKAELAKANARVLELETANAALTKSVSEQGEALTKAIAAAESATVAATTAGDQLQKMAGAVGGLLEKAKGRVRVVSKTDDGNAPASDAADELAKAEASGKPVPFATAFRATRLQPLGIDYRPRA